MIQIFMLSVLSCVSAQAAPLPAEFDKRIYAIAKACGKMPPELTALLAGMFVIAGILAVYCVAKGKKK